MNAIARQRIHQLATTVSVALIAGVCASCGAPDTGGSAPDATVSAVAVAPTGLRWTSYQGVALPSADQGPARTDGPVAGGFDRSPAGAALAAIHATVRISVAPDSDWAVIGHQMLAPGAGRDAWALARAQISITAPVTDGAPKILGYTVAGYSPDVAEIDIYSLHPDNSLTRNHTQLTWHHDDWRLELPATAGTNPVAAVAVPPADLIAFTPPR
ncbi:hypothetical protein [Nocardia cyriacigeorgica]|uniref:DUF8175 domain-containing protein n=1 Tax=Nocardia cyriacigeorgica TaxID=135487 RepID=A0A4U8VWG9_9NOCA|nr:hypothetical protein [Nocardia cyriacigeorgica]VFA96264.1 Uncharacterised protein [Nocardia cyriacigeorgica]